MASKTLTFNGIDGDSGDYLLPPLSSEQLDAVARGETLDKDHFDELKKKKAAKSPHYGPIEGVDARDLGQAGWGVIFAHKDKAEQENLREALSQLLEHRKRQATTKHAHFYREFVGNKAYRPGETKAAFLERQGAGPGPVDPDKMPYYLLIVGDPETIPYSFQYQLDVQYAVGRIYFDTLDEYAQYARSVVESETSGQKLARKTTFFGVANPGDEATTMSIDDLIVPLSGWAAENLPSWTYESVLKKDATRARLEGLLGGPETPALLFTASHGMGFKNGSARQLAHQGALLCQDWPGPSWRGPVPEDFYFAGDHVSDNAQLRGLIAFCFACYGAGTPQMDDFYRQAFKTREAIAPHSFIGALPRRLLSHPKGGALAMVGHVDRAWSYSFQWNRAGQQIQTFQSALHRLLNGFPIGSALDYFNERYAELSCDLRHIISEIEEFDYTPDELELAGLWTATNDARNFVVIGDPAVRLQVDEPKEQPGAHPTLSVITAPAPPPPPDTPEPAAAPSTPTSPPKSFAAEDDQAPPAKRARKSDEKRKMHYGKAFDAKPEPPSVEPPSSPPATLYGEAEIAPAPPAPPSAESNGAPAATERQIAPAPPAPPSAEPNDAPAATEHQIAPVLERANTSARLKGEAQNAPIAAAASRAPTQLRHELSATLAQLAQALGQPLEVATHLGASSGAAGEPHMLTRISAAGDITTYIRDAKLDPGIAGLHNTMVQQAHLQRNTLLIALLEKFSELASYQDEP
jgi:hypothetical protein